MAAAPEDIPQPAGGIHLHRAAARHAGACLPGTAAPYRHSGPGRRPRRGPQHAQTTPQALELRLVADVHHLTVKHHPPTAGRMHAADQAQQGGFPAPGATQHRRHFATGKTQGNVVEDRAPAVVAERHVINLDERTVTVVHGAGKNPDCLMHEVPLFVTRRFRPERSNRAGSTCRPSSAISAAGRNTPSGTRRPRARPAGLRESPRPPATGRGACRRPRTPCPRWSRSRP